MAMQVFVTVVDCGSQSAAADKLDLSRPVVSRYLAEMEEWIGARLLHRTTRKLSLTAAGNETLPRCRQMLEWSSDMQMAVAVPEKGPQGLLRITVSTSFGQAHMAQAVAAYVVLASPPTAPPRLGLAVPTQSGSPTFKIDTLEAVNRIRNWDRPPKARKPHNPTSARTQLLKAPAAWSR